MKSIFTEQEIDFIKQNYNTMTCNEIGAILGFTGRQIRGKANGIGLVKNRKFDKQYFHNIDKPDKAYYVGLLFADGWIINNVSSRTYECSIQLQIQDRYILEHFNKELGGVHNIDTIYPEDKIINGIQTRSGYMCQLRIYSKNIVNDLINIGVITNKTDKPNFPLVPNIYFYDFLRGYIDGDGCFYDENEYITMHITCSHRQPLEYIQSKLSLDGITTTITKENNRKYRLHCCNKNSMNILAHKLYYNDNVTCLIRKKNKIESFLIGSAT